MTIPIRGTVDNANKIAADLDENFTNMYRLLSDWRARIETASGVDSWETSTQYQTLAALRTGVEARVGAGANTGGISSAYIRSYPDHQGGSWNGAQEWTATRTALDVLIAFLRDQWPEKTTTGKPAYQAFHPTTSQLTSFFVPFTGAAKASLLAKIDTVLATFTPI